LLGRQDGVAQTTQEWPKKKALEMQESIESDLELLENELDIGRHRLSDRRPKPSFAQSKQIYFSQEFRDSNRLTLHNEPSSWDLFFSSPWSDVGEAYSNTSITGRRNYWETQTRLQSPVLEND
jgi:hypothetical protein